MRSITSAPTEQIATNCDVGAGCGMLPVVQIAGLALVTALVVGAIFRYRGGEGSLVDGTRGQMMGPPNGFVTLFIIIALVGYVGISIVEEVREASPGQLCAGMWGCSAPPTEVLIGVATITVLGLAGVAYHRCRTPDQEQ